MTDSPDWLRVRQSIHDQVERYGISVSEATLPDGIPGRICGSSVQINKHVSVEMRCHVMAHCFGHIVQWSVNEQAVRNLYGELKAAKLTGPSGTERLLQVLLKFRRYEEEASEYGATLYQGEPDALREFSVFARADIESHLAVLAGNEVVPWDSYFAAWRNRVCHGEIQIVPFCPKAIPSFQPVKVPEIDVIQVVSPVRSLQSEESHQKPTIRTSELPD